jgi:hypothetical protein
MVYTQFVADKNFLNNGTVGQALTIRLAGCWNDSHIDTRKTCNVHIKYFELRCLDGYLDGWALSSYHQICSLLELTRMLFGSLLVGNG